MSRQRRNPRSSKRPIFLDTGYLVALINGRDQDHPRAQRWRAYLQDQLIQYISTEAVLWEWLNGCSHRALRMQAAEGYRLFHEDEQVLIVPFEPASIQAALSIYKSRSDKDWSLTDCLSFAVMQEEGIMDALTADHHFEQAGFRALLLEDPPS